MVGISVGSGTGGGAVVATQANKPTYTEGGLWYDLDTGILNLAVQNTQVAVNGTSGGIEGGGEGGASVTIANQANAPTQINGDLWFDLDSGDFNLGVQNFWVTVNTPAKIQNDALIAKNMFINPGMSVAQRGTVFTLTAGTARVFVADRWVVGTHPSGTTGVYSRIELSEDDQITTGNQYAAELDLTIPNGSIDFLQMVENIRSFIPGETYIVSFWAKATASVALTPQVHLHYGDGGSVFETIVDLTDAVDLRSTMTRFSYSFVMPSFFGKTIGPNSSVWVGFIDDSNTVVKTTYTGFKLEKAFTSGQTEPTQLDYVDPATNLSQCQRFYETTYDEGVAPGTSSSISGYIEGTANSDAAQNSIVGFYAFKVEKRARPLVTFYTLSGTPGFIDNASQSGADYEVTGYGGGTKGISRATHIGSFANRGDICTWHCTFDAEF